jgi:hypothetical protein
MGEAFSTARQYTSRAQREALLAEATLKRNSAINEFLQDPLLTLPEAAQAMGGVAIATLRDWIRHNELNVVRIGRKIFVLTSEVRRIRAGGNGKK